MGSFPLPSGYQLHLPVSAQTNVWSDVVSGAAHASTQTATAYIETGPPASQIGSGWINGYCWYLSVAVPGYLLDNSTKSGFFREVMGFTEKTIGAALRSHFVENVAKNSKFNQKGLLEVTGTMTGANGRVALMTIVWQWVGKTKTWDFVTSVPTK